MPPEVGAWHAFRSASRGFDLPLEVFALGRGWTGHETRSDNTAHPSPLRLSATPRRVAWERAHDFGMQQPSVTLGRELFAGCRLWRTGQAKAVNATRGTGSACTGL